MIPKLILSILLFVNILNAAVVNTNKDSYTKNENILVNFSDMTAKNHDWIAIYAENDNNDWENVIKWKWTNNLPEGDLSFDSLPIGTYEVRAFYNNSYTVEASHKFAVALDANAPTTVSTNKNTYSPTEQIVVNYTNTLGHEEDWVAIYPAGSTNAWINMIQWQWTNGEVDGSKTFEALPEGDYEMRLFFQNSFNVEASHPFSVKNTEFNLLSRKNIYDPFELIHADFVNMRGEASDWIGIFPLNSGNQKESAIEWRYVKSLVNGKLAFNGLPEGAYEMKAFFATLHKKTIAFTVHNRPTVVTMYEDAEDGIDPRWVHYAGKYPIKLLKVGAQGSTQSIRHHGYWENGGNPAGYYFPFGNPEKKMKFLDLDLRIGVSSHVFNFGVIVDTKNGTRRIIWASWMNHINGMGGVPKPPFHTGNGYVLMNPGPTDYYWDTRNGQFIHYKINVEKTLRILEPDNELLKITGFTTSGGDYDNLSLRSQ
jgi:hypothetical protein